MNIKEIALRIGEEADEYADAKLQSKGEFHPDWHTVHDEYFAEALISAYKAELLKEVVEPVGYHYIPNNEMFPVEETSRSNLKNNPQDYVFLYTSDQVAAAILEATRPLEEECEFQRNAHKQAEELMLEQSNQLAAEQLNNKLLRDALWAVIKVHGYESGIPVEAISAPASTEALDAYVKQKIKEYY